MKLLQLYNRVPYPLKDGGAIAVHSLAQGLRAAGVDVQLFALNPSRNYCPPERIPADLRADFKMQLHPIDTRLRPVGALYNLLEGSSYHISRFFQPAVAERLKALLQAETYDLIQLEAPFVGPYLPILRAYSQAPVVLRAHNVDHLIWERLAAGSRNPLKAWYLSLQAARLKAFEEKLWQEVDGILAISEVDAAYIRTRCSCPVLTSPTGIKLEQYQALQRDELRTDRLGFLGSMDWQPNQEAVRWFAQELWPSLKHNFPEVSAHFAGIHFPQSLLQLGSERLEMVGEVPDAQAFLRQHPICIVPMLSGSGIRIKLLEAMAIGLPIISTHLGAEGLPVEHGKHLLFADDAASFAVALQRLRKDEDFAFNLGQNGRELIEMQFDNSKLSQRLIQFYQQLQA